MAEMPVVWGRGSGHRAACRVSLAALGCGAGCAVPLVLFQGGRG